MTELRNPTYKRFIISPPPDALCLFVSWEDNPWFPDELRAEKDYLYKVDPGAAEHVWGGATRANTEAQVLHGKWRVESFEPKEDCGEWTKWKLTDESWQQWRDENPEEVQELIWGNSDKSDTIKDAPT